MDKFDFDKELFISYVLLLNNFELNKWIYFKVVGWTSYTPCLDTVCKFTQIKCWLQIDKFIIHAARARKHKHKRETYMMKCSIILFFALERGLIPFICFKYLKNTVIPEL